MTFIITLIALVIERFFHWSHLRHWRWFARYQRWLLHTRLSGLSSYLLLLITILPPIIAVGVINLLLDDMLYGVLKLIFGVIVLMYCLGPNNLWVQAYSCIAELHKEDPKLAVERVQAAFGIMEVDNSQAFHQSFVRAIFLAANQRIFAVVFWFVVLGPVGAVLYRSIRLCTESPLGLAEISTKILRILDWLPVRILAFIFALGGHFTQVMARFKRGVFTGVSNNNNLLVECGVASLDVVDGNKFPEDGSAERESIALLDRVFCYVVSYFSRGCVDNVMKVKRKQLFHWCTWFLAANSLLFWLIGLSYAQSIPWMNDGFLSFKGKVLIGSFFAISYIGQLGLLACLPALLIVPLILIFPWRNFLLPIASLISALWLILLIGDIVIYSSYRFHLNGILLSLILHSFDQPVFDLSRSEIIRVSVIVVSVFTAEIIIASFLWWRLQKQLPNFNVGKWIVITVVSSLYFSYSLFVLSIDSRAARVVLDSTRPLPLYTEFLGAVLPIKNGRVGLERVFERYLLQASTINEPLNYPIQKLQFSAAKPKLNLLVIVIDTWRFDMLIPQVVPNVYQFAQQSTVFQNHFSGGDATGPGIFSLFYGIPAVYWTAMEDHHRGPVLIDELLKRHYQPEILSSGELYEPSFEHTVFAAIKNLSVTTPGATPYERDVNITRTFTDFIQRRAKQAPPFFGFLFYDAAHSYCAVSNNLTPFQPVTHICNRIDFSSTTDPQLYFNRYKNSLLLVDHEVGQVLQLLKDHRLMDNTVVIITGDHGEEFNDNHLGYWGHASNFTHYQVQTPLIVYWPHMPPKKISYMTAHYDIAPTLMTQLLGCTTPPNQYSDGTLLF